MTWNTIPRIFALALAIPALLLAEPKAGAAQSSAFPARVLITNDNGIADPKIVALARSFSEKSETWVVAPSDDRSGSGNYLSLSATGKLPVTSRDLGPRIRAFAVDGFPADCVVLALAGLMDAPPDLVVSGINGGPNLGTDWMFSGTVGAARVAAFAGVPAIAVSGLDDDIPGAVDAAVEWVTRLASSLVVQDMQPGEYLTVSLPRTTPKEIYGVRIVNRAPLLRYPRLTAEKEGAIWRVNGMLETNTPVPSDSDQAAYDAGYIAVIPMRADEVDHERLSRWRTKLLDLPKW